MSRYILCSKRIVRLITVLLILVLTMSITPVASAVEISGSCGESLEWYFDSGILTITGKGDMTNYSYQNYAPWYEFRDQILRLELPEGLTRVGSMAFFDCTNLQAIILPSTVKSVGELAFCQCTSAVIVNLNEGLESIERSSFELCSSVQDIRFPDTLMSLGRRSFYRCETLRYMTIPGSVTDMGASVFAYCTGLIRVDVYAPVSTLPRWTFYGCKNLSSISLMAETTALGELALEGCESLTTVYYDGTEMDAETLKEQIMKDKENFDAEGEIVSGDSGNSGSSVDAATDENGDVIVSDSTVTKTDDAVINVIISGNASQGSEVSEQTRIEATIWEPEGWDQFLEAIRKAVEASAVDATVYPANGSSVPKDFLDELAGKNVTMHVVTGSGSKYTIDFSMVGKVSLKNGLDLTYTLTQLSNVTDKNIVAEAVYALRFDNSSEIAVELIVQLPQIHIRQIASLYQIEGMDVKMLQSVVVDESGAAHFYLANVDKGTEYLIGITVSDAVLENTIVPEGLQQEYGITEQINNVDYVITGRKSSWGIGFLEVNQILLGIMLSTAAFVGLTMYALNKRKIRKGILPGWDDLDDGES